MKKLLAAAAAVCLSTGSAHAYVIAFTGVPTGAFTSSSEGGFAVTGLTGNLAINSRGAPGPSLLTSAPGASFQVTSTTGLFTFSSFAVDLNSTDTDDSTAYTVTGFLGGQQVFSQGDSEFGAIGTSFTTINSVSGATIDRLVFRQVTANPGLFFDNINVNASATPAGVPEPATWAVMLVGFGTVGASLRTRGRPKIRFA